MVKITGGTVFGPDLRFHNSEVEIRDGVFGAVRESDNTNAGGDGSAAGDRCIGFTSDGDQVINASGCYVIPGLIDIHFHGALGYDVCDASRKAYEEIAKYEAMNGITAICPATLTLPVEKLEEVLRIGADFARSEHEGSDLIGFNMEGPFISHVKKGAQNEAYILHCDPAVVERFMEASDGLVKIIGLAPEENPGFEDYIAAVRDRVIISLAHTNADYETAVRAFRAGASHAVHLYNAMTDMTHRAPGVVGAVSDCAHVNAEIICDGIHVHPAAVRAALRMNGKDRMVLISDSLRCTGMPDGEYMLGGEPVVKKGRYCTLKEGGNLAGSVSNVADCMRNVVKTMDIPLETAVQCATINPARAIHEDAIYGSITPGKKADAVLLRKDADFTLAAVIKDGRVIAGEM